jgi:dipeptidyl aminopeptidase/acylaminoacyl peptidase
MFKLLLSSLVAMLVTCSVQASNKIPLEVFAKPETYKTMKISPTGKYMAFTYEQGTEVKLGVVNRKTQKPTAGFEFGDYRHVAQFDWVSDDRLSMTVYTNTGWLDGANPRVHWYVANADGSNRMTLWDDQNFANLWMIDPMIDDPDHVLAVKQAWQDGGEVKLYKVNIVRSGKRHADDRLQLINDSPPAAAHTTPGIVDFATDTAGNVRFAIEYDAGEDLASWLDDSISIHYKSLGSDKWQELAVETEREDRPEFNFLGTNTNNDKLYFSSNYDMTEKDTLGAFELDLATREISLLFRHPDVDVEGAIKGNSGQVIGFYYAPGYPTIEYVEEQANLADIKLHKGLSASFPGQFMSVTSLTKDKQKYILFVRSDRNPGDFYLFDKKNMKVDYIGSRKPEVDPKLMAAVEPFSMVARDGLKMYGQLTLPNGVEQKNLPMVVYPHGGPYGIRDFWGWDRRAQMMASRGYLVLQLDFRGSGGYGTAFEEAGHGEWGAKMQDDLTDATQWAIAQGLADPDRVCIHGVSYGGYAAMNAVVKEPGLYKCSIPDAGIYDFKAQWDNADSFVGRFGSDRKEAYIKQSIGSEDNMRERSPAYHVDKLKAELFIVHGGDDVRVPIINAEILERELQKVGKSYIKLYKDDEGHGFSKPENRVELYQKILDFLADNIGN